MDMGEKDKFQQEKRNEDHMSYHSTNVCADWQFGQSNLTNTPMGSIPTDNSMEFCKGDLVESSCSSAPIQNSYCPTIWGHHTNTQNMSFCDISLQNSASISNTLGVRKDLLGPLSFDKTLNMGWSPPNSMVKGGIFLPTAPGMHPQSLSQFPADSGFIERAVRFSCFSGGNIGDKMNPLSIPECMNPYARGAVVMQQPQEVFAGNGLNSVSVGQSQKNEVNMAEASKDVSLSLEPGTTDGSPLKNDRKSKNTVLSHDEAKQEDDEAEFSGGGDQEEPSMMEGAGMEPSSSKALGLKKRKRSIQDNEPDQANEASQPPGETAKDNTEIQQKGHQTPTSTTNKPNRKHGKQGSQASDSPKEEYIHVRARRGQATNSHSLAERVRREKISERMKFLQDLVPGCSKVTGKAVMLDEIINYVQSLQRQVEFLSMKLATVNPNLDFNLDELLAKDILHSQAGPSSTLGYSPDMTMSFPSPHPSQPGLTHRSLPVISTSSDTLRRSINSQLMATSGGFKEPIPQVSNLWGEDELHNVVQMGFNSSAPLNSQDLNRSLPPGNEKVEL